MTAFTVIEYTFRGGKFVICTFAALLSVGQILKEKPAFAAMHGPHSLVRIGPGCADRA